ncbi:MAG: polyamine ABC transporter substrate-binding protein [Desulfobacteraceae bacterium]|nr:polyamine ABC transporter substrate-binding protein [Desulfobacteraceae bacterium]
MKKKTRLLSTKLAVALAVIVMLAFSFNQALAAEGQVLRMACKYGDAKSLDAHRATGSQDRLIAALLFNGLVQYQPGNLSVDAIIPDLATEIPSPKVLADGRQQWIFKLKQGVMTHPYEGNLGYELTSEDVVYSLERAADPKRSSFSVDYSGMTFEALDKYTVQITVDKPLSGFLFLPKLANRGGGLVVAKKALEEKGDEWFKIHPVGTGPFVFQKYVPREKVIVVRNPNYFRGAPKLAGVEWYYMPIVSSREMALQKGEMDVIEGPKEQVWAEKMMKIPGVVVDWINSSETIIAHFNMTVKPLNLLKVRQAIAYAMNRKEFVAVYGEKNSAPIYSSVPVGRMIAGLTSEEVAKEDLLYEYDLSKAKKLLAEAGYPNGFSLDVFTSESKTYKRAYELMQAQLRRINIDLKLSVVDHSAFHARIRQNLNPIVFYACMRPNPDVFLTQFYYSDSIVVTGKKAITNFSHIGEVDADGDGKIDSVDNLIVRARLESNPNKQVALWKEAQLELLRKLASYPIVTVGYIFARNPKVDWGFELVTITDGPKPTEITKIAK